MRARREPDAGKAANFRLSVPNKKLPAASRQRKAHEKALPHERDGAPREGDHEKGAYRQGKTRRPPRKDEGWQTAGTAVSPPRPFRDGLARSGKNCAVLSRNESGAAYASGRSTGPAGAAGRMSPFLPMVTTSQGSFLPERATASDTACSMPPQQGTSMRSTVMLRTAF